MRQIRHPLVRQDVDGILDHIISVTGGDHDAAGRRLTEIDDLLDDIARNPASGVRLSGPLRGWLARHGGRDQRVTVVFRPDLARSVLYIALIAFGGRNWLAQAESRRDIGEAG